MSLLSLQTYGHVLQQISVQPTSAGLQPSPPSSVSVLQPPPEAALVPDAAVEAPKLLMPPGEMAKAVEEMAHSISQTEAFVQHLQQVGAFPTCSQGSSHQTRSRNGAFFSPTASADVSHRG